MPQLSPLSADAVWLVAQRYGGWLGRSAAEFRRLLAPRSNAADSRDANTSA